MNQLLEVKDLHVSFQGRQKALHAVRGVSFDLLAGETVALVGESGCGKSTLAKAILRLLPAHATLKGELLYEEKDLLLQSEKEMRQIRGKEISMIFQDPMTSLNPTLKIGHQIAEAIRRHEKSLSQQEIDKEVISLLEMVGIPDAPLRASHYPHTLSGGMRQRVMIAIALAAKPKILIADEPTTALDVTIQAQILELLKEIQQRTKTTILLITHDLGIVAGMCDRALVMYAGKIVEAATVEELFYYPSHPYTELLLRSLPRLDYEKEVSLLAIEGTPPDLTLSLTGCAFCPRCPKAKDICHTTEPSFLNNAACWNRLLVKEENTQ